ncbi:unnamed protein product [Didymodactylos carnosus]|uniref:Palmitoyltransferase n=1 Tax=Didymodactylos carnosus TaxID=1234261 RepID=A0A8S2H3M8_9BILA|nr:unnamed protein product [Didymodactylos carnosus]CAF3590811.1 unnamed protein product [Didymodactylos carnosus]
MLIRPSTFGLSTLFFAFDCRYLSLRLSPIIPVIGGLLFIFVISVMFRAACSDPGIIPRATPEEVIYLERLDVSNNPQNVALPGRIVEVQINGQTIQLKFCQTCKMYRPPRTSHCSVCDNCVGMYIESHSTST